ncbi:MAG: hypothetical protein HY537_13405 [Deltaproteobacteria bacterium]|nr:hypothetical protein [Deltaproteobacteria bacterium]
MPKQTVACRPIKFFLTVLITLIFCIAFPSKGFAHSDEELKAQLLLVYGLREPRSRIPQLFSMITRERKLETSHFRRCLRTHAGGGSKWIIPRESQKHRVMRQVLVEMTVSFLNEGPQQKELSEYFSAMIGRFSHETPDGIHDVVYGKQDRRSETLHARKRILRRWRTLLLSVVTDQEQYEQLYREWLSYAYFPFGSMDVEDASQWFEQYMARFRLKPTDLAKRILLELNLQDAIRYLELCTAVLPPADGFDLVRFSISRNLTRYPLKRTELDLVAGSYGPYHPVLRTLFEKNPSLRILISDSGTEEVTSNLTCGEVIIRLINGVRYY